MRESRSRKSGASCAQVDAWFNRQKAATVDQEDTDYFGSAVNLAARVESLAERGEVVLSSSTASAWDVAGVLEAQRVAQRTVRTDAQFVKGVAEAVNVVRVRVVEDP